MARRRWDVAVVGGGPAGATAASLLARAGLDVVCLERERFPRFRIGESLLPASMPILQRLGVLTAVEESGAMRKYGATFIDDVEGRRRSIVFARGWGWPEYAFNVQRAEFDRLLLAHAEKEGATVSQGTAVDDVDLASDGVRLQVRTEDGTRGDLEAAFLVDATGRDAIVASRLGRRDPMPDLGKVALFAHVRGGERWSGRQEGFIRIVVFEHGWFWWIPFAGDVASVGCVLHRRAFRTESRPIEAVFEDMVVACPSVDGWLAGAQRITPVRSAANFSYRTSPVIGDRFVAIGDAVTFVDPIFSTGVYVAMQSAECAILGIRQSFRRGRFRADHFTEYLARIHRGTRPFFRLIEQYYDPSFLEVFLAPNPPPVLGSVLRRALTAVLAGGTFMREPLWVRSSMGILSLLQMLIRYARRRRGQAVESRLLW